MIVSVSGQIKLFLLMILSGILTGLLYDFIRLLRRLIKHKNFFVQAEDLLFWLIISIGIFLLLLEKNFGQVRFFCVAGIFLGMFFYWGVFSSFVLKILFCVGDFFIKAFLRALKICLWPLKILFNLLRPFFLVIKKFFYNLYLRIKKYFYICDKRAKLKTKSWLKNLKIMFKKI